MVYEVYGNVESAKFGHLSKVQCLPGVVGCVCVCECVCMHINEIVLLQLSEVEERLAALESLVGNTDTKGVSYYVHSK